MHIFCYELQKRKIFGQRAAGILISFGIFIGITCGLNRMYVDVDADNWYRFLWHYFYKDQGKIDNLYLGSSHVYCDVDPQILDGLSGKYNFNLATPAQRLNGSYYLLREAGRKNELSHVYLEMYYGCNLGDEGLLEYRRNWANTDHIKLSANKIAYLLSTGGIDQYINALFPFSRYRICLGDWEYVRDQLAERKQDDYRKYRYEEVNADERMVCERQGFQRSTRVYKDSQKIREQGDILEGYSMGERNEQYIRMIIEYCNERKIPITLFTSPINDLQLISVVDYDDYVIEVKRLAAEYGIPFYDFNLAKEEYLPLQDSKNYRDIEHLNETGANLFTTFFYEVVTGKEADNEKYFYGSYEEKLRNLSPTVYGIYYNNSEQFDGGETIGRTMWIASNRDSGMEYQIVMAPNEGDEYIVQSFAENMMFQVPLEEHGRCKIVARVKGSLSETQALEINY